MRQILPLLLAGASAVSVLAADESPLSGTPIGTAEGVQYDNGVAYNVDNIQSYAFDGDLETYFATRDRSYTWVGLDLGTPHIITRAGWAPRNDGVGPGRICLGVIQGANSPDFLDALPLYLITENGVIGQMTYADIDCSKGFRYVRFVGPGDSRCNIAELEFYGHEGEGDDSRLFQPTNLPTVIVNTVNAEEPYDKEHDITSNIIILANGQVNVDKPGTIRERGNASRQFPKKPWRLKFDKKQNVLDAPAKAKKWTLINNYGDKTLMRNMVAFESARQLGMKYVSYCQPVDVFLNGEYKGCYQLCDQMEVNDGRLEITEMEPEDIEGDALTGGYFFEVDGYATDEPAGTWFISPSGIPVTIKSPDLEDDYRDEQYNYIKDYFHRMETLVFTGNFADPVEGYRSILDIDSFLKYFMVGELSGNTDTYWSTYMYKERLDPAIYTGPVWDFDLGFDNDSRTYPINNLNGYLYISSKTSSAGIMRNFVRRIIEDDPQTAVDITRIWSAARNAGFSAESLNAYVDSVAEYLDQSQRLNFMRWPILEKYVHMNPRIYHTYEGEVNAIKSYITKRFERLDMYMHYDPNSGVDLTPAEAAPQVHVTDGSVALDGNTRYCVISVDGTVMYTGTATSPRLQPGIYVVRTAAGSLKIAVR